MSGSSGYVPITIVNVNQQVAPAPNLLQRRGAIISQGATTLAVGTYLLLTQPATITSHYAGAETITSMVFASNIVTVTVAGGHGIPTGDTVNGTISGVTPAGYNGTFPLTATSTTVFTYPLSGSTPGTVTVQGMMTLEDVAEVQSAVTTFFGQGNSNAVYVLELGAGTEADGVTALQTFITANPGFFYSYLIPHAWGITAGFFTFALAFNSTTAKTYFHVTTTLAYYQANPTVFAETLKCCLVMIEAPTVAAAFVAGTPTEFSAAARWYVTLNLNPSPTNQVTQLAYSFVFGVTPYPIVGNSSLFATLKAANIGIIGTGAEGGISNTICLYGRTLDGNDFNKYWYSVDNVQINLDLVTSNAIINGSNNPQAPLNYDQLGINTIQAVASNQMQREIGFSLALGTLVQTQMNGTDFAAAVLAGTFAGQVVVNAVPFFTYVQGSPSDYAIGLYQGLSVAYTVQNGFDQIIYNVTVSNFVA
jgi:hypothetical protein